MQTDLFLSALYCLIILTILYPGILSSPSIHPFTLSVRWKPQLPQQIKPSAARVTLLQWQPLALSAIAWMFTASARQENEAL